MEPARDLLGRPLPHILHDGGIESPSTHGDPVSATFFTRWEAFYEDVCVELQSLDLDGKASFIELCTRERYLTANEPGLTARFVRDLCDPVSEALSVTHLRQIIFGDVQYVRRITKETPDLVMVKVANPEQPNTEKTSLVLVGEINARLLSTSGNGDLQNSVCESFYRHQTISQQTPTTISAFNSRTITIGQNGEARAAVACVNILHSLTPGKATMEVDFAGRKAVAKYWSEPFQKRANGIGFTIYEYEKAFYGAMVDRYPGSYKLFSLLLEYGEVVCSSLVAGGAVMILSWEDGERLSDFWQSLSQPDRIYIRKQCLEAVKIIRQLGIYLQDSRKENVLYNRCIGKATMVDFEHYGICTERHMQNLDAPELLSIFGRS